MNIVITGSLGYIGKPLTEILVNDGHQVTVISSSVEKTNDIKKIGAIPAIGSLENADFLAETFEGKDAAFCMIPPNFKESNQIAYYTRIANNYVTAIQSSGVDRVVLLSSWGAHLDKGTGIILGSHHSEIILEKLQNQSLVFVRPASFYYNAFTFIPMIKNAGFIGTNYGENDPLVWVHPTDIAEAIADELISNNPEKRKIRYVASDEMTASEMAKILGAAIGIPDLEWKILPAEAVKNAMLQHGLSENIASDIVDLNNSIHTGAMGEDYRLHKPVLGKVKVADFAREFAAVYNKDL